VGPDCLFPQNSSITVYNLPILLLAVRYLARWAVMVSHVPFSSLTTPNTIHHPFKMPVLPRHGLDGIHELWPTANSCYFTQGKTTQEKKSLQFVLQLKN